MEVPKMENLKVLLIDSEPEFLDACRSVFNDAPHQVLCVSSKEQAQQVMNGSCDLIILGTLSPAGQTLMLQRWLKRHPIYKYIPLLIIDSCFHERRHKGWRIFEGLQMEAEEYTSKPLEPSDLAALIHKLSANILSADRRQMLETCWNAFLALDKEDRKVLANRIIELET
jgi:DNA-binding response OmpR family regulator